MAMIRNAIDVFADLPDWDKYGPTGAKEGRVTATPYFPSACRLFLKSFE